MMIERYYLKADHEINWSNVTREQFIAAEQAAGFRSKFGDNHVATGGFTGRGMRGRVEYVDPEIEVSAHNDPSCPCHEWSAKSPSESPALPEREVDCPVLEAKNILSGDSELNSPIPAHRTASTFDREWELAPTVATRYMEREVAEYWFLRGMRAERDCATESANQDLRELVELVRS